MEEELYEMRQFAGLLLARGAVPDETTILEFRHVLERHDLARHIFETVKGHLQAKGLMLRQGGRMPMTPRPWCSALGERALAGYGPTYETIGRLVAQIRWRPLLLLDRTLKHPEDHLAPWTWLMQG